MSIFDFGKLEKYPESLSRRSCTLNLVLFGSTMNGTSPGKTGNLLEVLSERRASDLALIYVPSREEGEAFLRANREQVWWFRHLTVVSEIKSAKACGSQFTFYTDFRFAKTEDAMTDINLWTCEKGTLNLVQY